ncbi:MAG: hypothetical protein ACFFDR_08905, partial [Candidatus Thorarchaeota archaeon]
DVERILSELPADLRETLPEEDLRRLTPATARELVDSLLASFTDVGREDLEKEEPAKKKKVKVTKVKKVKKKTGPTKEELLDQIPDEVKSQVPPEVLADLSLEDLEALISSGSDSADLLPDITDEEVVEEEPKPEKKEVEKKKKVVSGDDRFQILIDKFGEEKAEILRNVPEEMLAGIPDDQIEEMDIDALKDLADALEPR